MANTTTKPKAEAKPEPKTNKIGPKPEAEAKPEPKTNKIGMTEVHAANAAMTAAAQGFGRLAQSASNLAILHCEQHGDTSAIKACYDALGGMGKRIGPQRQQAFKSWLKAYSPVRMNNKTGVFGLVKKTSPNYVPFDTDSATTTFFLEFKPDSSSRGTVYTNGSIARRIANMFTKEYETGENWKGKPFNKTAVLRMVEERLNDDLEA